MTSQKSPLCVELDGTLSKTRLFWEMFARLVLRAPWMLIVLAIWGLRGKDFVFRKLLERCAAKVQHLPLDKEVIKIVKAQQSRGRTVVLSSPFGELITQKILGNQVAFDAIVHKARAEDSDFLEEYQLAPRVFNISALVKTLRPHQWAKNILIFVPLMAGHEYIHADKVVHSVAAFVAFCLTASFVYVTNDLLDLESDRQHKRKRKRGLASGALSVRVAILILPMLVVPVFILGTFLHKEFQLSLLAYVILSSSYSWWIKRVILLDVLVLAALYMARVISGGYATDIVPSGWLLIFSLGIFTSLGFMKRYIELESKRQELHVSELASGSLAGRGYLVKHTDVIFTLGLISGFFACVVFAFYLNSANFVVHYKSPAILSLGCVVIVYWISHVWRMARKGLVHDDPVVFALKDKSSYIAGGVFLAIILCAKFF
ncbi:UbiA family prenyltransferase [Akkermansiaceae bacterium]|nr:UbiA family prenyltransferase [Akkermansiaceae bacterium]